MATERSPLVRDLRRAAALALFGCVALAATEFLATLSSYSQRLGFETVWRLLVLDVALIGFVWLGAVPLLTGVLVLARRLRPARAAAPAVALEPAERAELAEPGPEMPPETAAETPPAPVAPRRRPPPIASIPWIWAAAIAVALYVGASTRTTLFFVKRFKEPQLMSLLLALIQVGLAAGAVALGLFLGRRLVPIAARFERSVGSANPLGHVQPAIGVAAILFLFVVELGIKLMPQMAPLVPWRHLLALAAFGAGIWLGALVLARRPLLPAAAGPRRALLFGGIAALLLLEPWALIKVGADAETKYVAVTASPTLSRLIDLVRRGNDFDRDGYGSLLGENDCAPFRRKIHPAARDIPDNGIDENCDGRDFSLSNMPAYKKGERMPVPPEFKRDWNFLLITVDTVRYDHTTFGGYRDGPKKRDTTPNLARLVAKAVNFTFCNAPSVGTMASMPAILTSKFFHSGIALDENVKHGMPPKLKPENVLISEVLKRGGYATGAITSHEYFNDWGMEQGFDSYDNEVGKAADPFKVTSNLLTDRTLAWIAHHSKQKWFLWTHFIDPHGRYVAHPGEKSFGTTEEDLYDGELSYTDKYLGKLFEELWRMPGGDRTIIIITSDHGDGFNEHGFINHGVALYRELTHVPLIIYVPNLEPRAVGGVVSNLDILPTVADLAGIDVSDLTVEGESLVAQLFYGRENPDRVVFAETNYPRSLRAAITATHKLIYSMQNNVYELYDLVKDPWEKTNVASKDKAAFASMKTYLDDWLERVYYSRDAVRNQAAASLMKDTLLTKAPTPQHPLSGVTFDDGKIEVLGWDSESARPKAGEKLYIKLYFRAADRPSGSFKLQVTAWAEGSDPASGASLVVRSMNRATRDGLFGSDRWRKGELIADRLGLILPNDLRGAQNLVLGLQLMDATGGKKQIPVGSAAVTPAAPPELLVLGSLPCDPTPAAAPAPAPARPVPPGALPPGVRAPAPGRAPPPGKP